MVDGELVCCGVSTRQAVGVAWDRAIAFSWVGQRVRGLAGFAALWLWPFHLLTVGGQGDRIRPLGGASLAVDDSVKHRVRWTICAVAVAAIAVEACLLLSAGVALSLALLPFMHLTLAAPLGMLLVLSPLELEVVGGVARVAGDRESLTLKRRRDELSKKGSASIMTSFVRPRDAPPGAGRRLLTAMKSEWRDERSVVVFYPATTSLVKYYAREGAVLDDDAQRRMKFDFRDPSQIRDTAGPGN